MQFFGHNFFAEMTTPESVQEDNFENQIVLLDGLSPKKNCPGSKLKIVLLDGLFFRGPKKALNSLEMKKKLYPECF